MSKINIYIYIYIYNFKIFPQETMAAGENRFAPDLNEKEVVKDLSNILGTFLIKQLFHSRLLDMR